MTVSNLLKADKQMQILKQIRELYGSCHVVFSGDFHHLLPIGGAALFQEDTIQFGAINKAVFLNISWQFKDDPEFGNIMRRLRNGTITKQDIAMLNTRYILVIMMSHYLKCQNSVMLAVLMKREMLSVLPFS